jgi:hypothetical protein
MLLVQVKEQRGAVVLARLHLVELEHPQMRWCGIFHTPSARLVVQPDHGLREDEFG